MNKKIEAEEYVQHHNTLSQIQSVIKTVLLSRRAVSGRFHCPSEGKKSGKDEQCLRAVMKVDILLSTFTWEDPGNSAPGLPGLPCTYEVLEHRDKIWGERQQACRHTQRRQGMLWWFAGEEGKGRVEDRGEETWRGRKGSTGDGLLVSRGRERTSRGKARPEAEEEAWVDRGRWKEPSGHKSQGREGRDQGPGEGKGRVRQEALKDTDAELCQMPI